LRFSHEPRKPCIGWKCVVSITPDCDNDTLLIKAHPAGPSCHTGTETCFGDGKSSLAFLTELESIIASRAAEPAEGSYVSKLFAKGINKIAQKVGEEAVETVIAAKDDDLGAFKNEAADLLFHYLVLLRARGVNLNDITAVLKDRRR
jgi:phosphoribosyl-ATP pyrophosphohydrolase/phosphoribosyl-AMP cyclohydrolase